jgi:hypothetical protein
LGEDWVRTAHSNEYEQSIGTLSSRATPITSPKRTGAAALIRLRVRASS